MSSVIPPYRHCIPMDNQCRCSTVTVEGEGSVTAEPDLAIVTIGVLTEDKDVIIAQKENQKIANNIIKAIKRYGVEDKDIKTIQYNIYPKYEYIEGKKILKGYEVKYIMQITVRDIEQTGKIIDVAVENGANIQQSISFTVSDYNKYYEQALELAVKNGKRKAKDIAITLLMRIIDEPLKVIEKKGQIGELRYEPNYLAKVEGSIVKTGIIKITAQVEEIFKILRTM